jgi:uncharacterized protein DUF4272
MNLQTVREKSIEKAKALGYEVNLALPLLDEGVSIRKVDEIVDRCLSLLATVAGSYGFEKSDAIDWLKQEEISSALAKSEQSFLEGGDDSKAIFQRQVEGLNAFAWLLGFVKNMEFNQVCENNLISLFPDIKNKSSSSKFRSKAKLISLNKAIEACDLAYCLHWALTEAELSNRRLPGDIEPHVIIERRRALEWVLCCDDWDELSLDT